MGSSASAVEAPVGPASNFSPFVSSFTSEVLAEGTAADMSSSAGEPEAASSPPCVSQNYFKFFFLQLFSFK